MPPASRRRVLAADVGGTHTRLALHEIGADPETPLAEARVRSAEHASLDALLTAFLASHGGPGLDAACVAVAGPVIDEGVDVTNLPWRVEARTLAAAIGSDRLRLLNDLEATAFGMLHLSSERFEVLQRGTRARADGPVVVVAAGTGLGIAVLAWDGRAHRPCATEGGHVGFAPRDEREIALLRHLQSRLGRVSVEQVVSGPGLSAVYDALREIGQDPRADGAPYRDAPDRSAAIAAAALEGSDPRASEALALFAACYGAAAGDAALAHLALGGVWLGGGIAPKILPALRRPEVREAFVDKGRFRGLLESLPLEVCLEPDTALRGAARLALADADAEVEGP